ncbi:aromatic ring-hydroxylating oxygenase subunit alpha [Cupriavidus lacunae]|nr:aromatic ring-hydroxylating dioxygenase subunit alpha [Cupriavidus lacunae]
MSNLKQDISVNAAVAETMISHLMNETTDLADRDIHVPVEHFVSPLRAQAEIDLMKTLPLLVAHRSELPNPGDFITRDVFGTPLLLSRQNDGSVQAFLNMCSHRGGRVETGESGNRRVFTCRYHGWSYDANGGGLRVVPYQTSFDPINFSTHGLDRIKTEEVHGLIFVDFSNNQARPVADYLGPEVEAQIAPWYLEDSTILIEKSYTLDINWKLLMDGAIDVLHPQFLHPGGVAELVETNVGVFRSYGRHGQHFSSRKKLRELAKNGDARNLGTKYIASNLVIYPNTMMIAAPEHVEFWTVWPTENPAKATVQIRFLVRKNILTPEIERRVRKSWDILENAASTEDWPMEEWIQQNATARPTGTFRYGRSELSAQHLHRQLARDLDGKEL